LQDPAVSGEESVDFELAQKWADKKNELRKAEAEVDNKTAEYGVKLDLYNRMKIGWERGVVGTKEWNEMKIQLAQAKNALFNAQKEKEHIENQLLRLRLAPATVKLAAVNRDLKTKTDLLALRKIEKQRVDDEQEKRQQELQRVAETVREWGPGAYNIKALRTELERLQQRKTILGSRLRGVDSELEIDSFATPSLQPYFTFKKQFLVGFAVSLFAGLGLTTGYYVVRKRRHGGTGRAGRGAPGGPAQSATGPQTVDQEGRAATASLVATADTLPGAPGPATDTLSADAARSGAGLTAAGPRRFGNYELLEEIARGGMAVVYKARQLGLKRLVALKVISLGSFAGKDQIARLQREAEALARLQHPNIVQIYEIDEREGLPFLSLEYVEGGTLAEKVKDGLLPPPQAARLLEAVARAVHAAHQRGILHRDLKPGNVLLTPDGVPKITDFGLAKQFQEHQELTRTGTVLGTPSYMAPEQAGGVGGQIGPTVDVYALGAILYELLTGSPPFRGTSLFETLDLVRFQAPVSPRQLRPELPADLESICLKCLAKQPGERYATADALAEDLRCFLENRAAAHG
jgi:hypothetical protein